MKFYRFYTFALGVLLNLQTIQAELKNNLPDIEDPINILAETFDSVEVKHILKEKLIEASYAHIATKCLLNPFAPIHFRIDEAEYQFSDWDEFKLGLWNDEPPMSLTKALLAVAHIHYLNTGEKLRTLDVCQALQELGLSIEGQDRQISHREASAFYIFLQFVAASGLYTR